MASSGTVTYSLTETDIITDALENIGALDPGESPTSADTTTARRKLNLIVKQWTSQLDFAPGLKMWTRRTGYVFLQKNQASYSLGPSGDNATESYVSTTLAAAAAQGASTITVASATGIANTYFLGIELDSGSIQWTTVNGAPSGVTVTPTATLTGAAASGNRVFCYQTKLRRPFDILTCVRRDTSGNDVEVGVNMGLGEYEAIYSKSAIGEPGQLYFEAQRTNSVIYLDCTPEDVTEVLRIRYLSYIEDFSTGTNDADFPIEWGRALTLQLSKDLCLPYSRKVPPNLDESLTEALMMARKAYAEDVVAEYQTDPDEY